MPAVSSKTTRGAPRWRPIKSLLLYVLAMLLCDPTWSMAPDQTLRQLNHKSWKVWDGAPPDIRAAAQTEDGTLWLGGPSGLYRFDGMRFVRYTGPPGQPFKSHNIFTLAAWPGQGLWIGFALGGIAVLKDHKVLRFDERDGLPAGTVSGILKDHDGSFWALTSGGLAHLRGTRWQRVSLQPDGPMHQGGGVVDHAGTLWILTANRLLARTSGQSGFREIVSVLPETDRSLAVAPDGAVWLADQRSVIRFEPLTEGRIRSRSFPIAGASSMLFDREGHLWLGGDPWPLRRLSLRLLAGSWSDREIAQSVEALGNKKADSALPLLEDREGNIWVTSSGGVDRFNRSRVVALDIPPPPGKQSPQVVATSGLVVVDGAGTLWVEVPDEQPGAARLLTIRDGVVAAQREVPFFWAAYRDVDGSLWFGGAGELAHMEGARFTPTPLPERATYTRAIVRDSAGALWVSLFRLGVFRLQNGQWTLGGGLQGLPQSPALVATADQHKNLWFGYPDNRIARVRDSTVQLFGAADGLDIGAVMAICAHEGHLWIGGELGFARFDGERFVPVTGASDQAFTGISGIITSKTGDLWLNGNTGISHISRTEVARVLRDPSYQPQYEMFDYRDGLVGTATQLLPMPSAFESADGRLWFGTTTGVVSITPEQIKRNVLPPPVTIWSITSGEKQYENVGAELHLPVHTSTLQIAYTAGSLTVPERVRFRYRLEGSDREWQDVGNRREAVYTNLKPGRYTFHVIAANNDGVWNTKGAAINFTIAPAFTQTTLFYTLCALVCLSVLYVLYRLRTRQVAAHVRARLEGQVAERERIARELHDTLLQGVQGLIWRFQAVANRISQPEPVRAMMERALDRADQMLGEARDRVKELRATGGEEVDLSRALAAEGAQLVLFHPVRFQTSVEGARRELQPIVSEEIVLIAREALRNVVQHSGAEHVEVAVSYHDSALHVRIRDDGDGICEETLNGGKPGHFGLLGMRERAEKIRAQVKMSSKPGAGTEIELQVPAAVAYRSPQTRSGCIQTALARCQSLVSSLGRAGRS